MGRVGNVEEETRSVGLDEVDGPIPFRSTPVAMEQCVKATLPVIPYCGFEPLVCHLLREKRSSALIRLDQVGKVTHVPTPPTLLLPIPFSTPPPHSIFHSSPFHFPLLLPIPFSTPPPHSIFHFSPFHFPLLPIPLNLSLLPILAVYKGDNRTAGGASPQHWQEGAIIIYSDVADVELYHFILPLRAHYLAVQELKPIVLLLKNEYVILGLCNVRNVCVCVCVCVCVLCVCVCVCCV